VAGKQLVSYDDVESVRRKAEYVKAEGLAGASLSTLDLDDFNNLCCQVKYFLHCKSRFCAFE
jgi:chitinase